MTGSPGALGQTGLRILWLLPLLNKTPISPMARTWAGRCGPTTGRYWVAQYSHKVMAANGPAQGSTSPIATEFILIRSTSAPVHYLYGYWTVPERRRRRILGEFHRWSAPRLAEHDVLDCVRSESAWSDVEREQLDPRSATAEDVAAQLVLTYKGGVCRSDDGGKTWAQSNSGWTKPVRPIILLDPTVP